MIKLFGILLILTTIVTLSACKETETTTTTREDGITELNIAQLASSDDPDVGKSASGFISAMEEALNVKITEIEGVSHLIGIEAMRSDSLDLMLASPYTYLSAVGAGAELEFIVSTQYPEEHTNRIAFVVGKDSSIEKLEDLEGETFAFVDTTSYSGFLNPIYLLVTKLDLEPARLMMQEPDYFFKQTTLSGGHENSLMAVINGDVTGAAISSSYLNAIVESGLVSEDEFRIIYLSDPDPGAGYIARSQLPETLLNDLREFLLNYEDETFFEIFHKSSETRFVNPNEEEIDKTRQLMKKLGI